MRQPLAYIHPEAQVADNVVVEPFVTIDKNVVIEEGTWIGPHVTIMEGAHIGKNCKIFPGAVISAVPQDLKFKGEKTRVEIGDNCIIRECVTINRGTEYANKTVVGNNCLLMAYVHVAHDCQVGDNSILANSVNLAGHVELGQFVRLGGAVNIQQFTQVGDHCFISGGSLVNKDIPPYIRCGRTPLSYIGVNSVGLRRSGWSSDSINHVLDIYRILFVRGYNTTNALKIIEAEIPDSEAKDAITTFVRDSVRGVVKGFSPVERNR
ncbi:MAG: acyl-ACP--UDP-N-acetylglucosamine O-acyltransferase [Chitinophagales bacterium]|jgi:UDP-N-acetylglucosamine acyltransferase